MSLNKRNQLSGYFRGTKGRWLAIGAATIGMGISMPSCPGQQAVQHQVDGLVSREADSIRRLQSLENQFRAMAGEMVQIKTLLSQVSNTVLAQKSAIENLEESLKHKGGGKAKAGGKKRR